MTTRPTDEEMDRCERMLTDCDCSPAYSDRGLTDPNCMACDLGFEIIDTFKAMRAELAERQAASDRASDEVRTLNAICDLFQIGLAVRDHRTILTNIENVLRRSECLWAIEREFFTREVPDEDGEEGETVEDCDLSWGATPAEYVAQFRAALQSIAQPVRVPDGEVRLWDTQWMNIVNHDNSYRYWSKYDAVAHAVKMTEAAIARNVSDGKLPPRLRAAPAYNGKKEG